MKKTIPFLLAFIAAYGAFSVGLASQTRVDSTGGLSLVLTDESDSLDPFVLGNPAGLALIPSQSRFDLGSQWFHEVFAANNNQNHTYGTLAQMGNDTVNYHGLIFFPTPQWALQGDGDFDHTENVRDLNITDQTVDRTRELFRTAYNFGPFTLGSQIQPIQATKTLLPTVVGGATVSGQVAETALMSTSGLLINLPGGTDPKQTQFRLGGIFATQVAPFQDQYNAVLASTLGPTTVNVVQTVTADTIQSFGPEIYFEIPQTLQAGVVTRFTTYKDSLSLTSDNTALVPNQSSYSHKNVTDTQVTGFFKLKNPLPSVKLRGPSVNVGGFCLVDSNQEDFFQPNGNTSSTQTLFTLVGGLGVGIEKEDDYLVGLQLSLTSLTGSYQPASSASQNINLTVYHISLGGETWISPRIAFRMGLVYDFNLNQGAQPLSGVLSIPPSGGKVDNTTITAGLGYKDKSFRTDLMLWVGQPNLVDSSQPDQFASQVGAQLAAAILFN